jgi:hypothetical protein
MPDKAAGERFASRLFEQHLRTQRGWAYALSYASMIRRFGDRDIIPPTSAQEMIIQSGQMLSLCVKVNGHITYPFFGRRQWRRGRGLLCCRVS